MLILVHVVLLAFESPGVGAFDAGKGAAADGDGAFGAEDVVAIFVVAARNLAMDDMGAAVLRIQIVDLDVIENVAALGRNVAAADGGATDWRFVAVGPLDFVDGVNSLLHKAVARDPGEVVPIAELPLDVADASRAGTRGGHRLDGIRQVGAVV